MTTKKIKPQAPAAIREAFLAAEKADIQELHEKALLVAFEQGHEQGVADHTAKVLELANETKAKAKPAAQTWWDKFWE